MQFRSRPAFRSDATIFFLTYEQISSGRWPFSHDDTRAEITALKKIRQIQENELQIFPVIRKGRIFLIVNLGDETTRHQNSLRTVTASVCRNSLIGKCSHVELVPHSSAADDLEAYVDGVILGTYQWKKYCSSGAGKSAKPKWILVAPRTKEIREAVTIAEGTNFARDIINDNADVTTSRYVEKQIRALIRGQKGFSLEVLGEKEMKAKGLGFHLAVNRASANPPRLIIVRYKGSAKKTYRTAMIGKGLTFDTGGLNLKPSGAIESMRLDIGGAVAVIGALKNCVTLRPKKNLLFVVGMAENVTGSRSYKPGDVLRGYAGKTVEVLNTDAEGRLVLADAISYVRKNYSPAEMIDVATLTGACIVGLGNDYAGLVSSNDDLAERLLTASRRSDDRAWRLPNYPELREMLKSNIADISNLGKPKSVAGALTAAEFLHYFAGDTPWAHLDIAGPSFVDGAQRMYFTYGGTGAGVRLLTRYYLA